MRHRQGFVAVIVALAILVYSRTGLAYSSNQHELSCKMMSIVAAMVGGGNNLNPRMLLFLVSDDHDRLSDNEGKRFLDTAYTASKMAILAFNAKDEAKTKAGLVIAGAAVLKACSYYCFDECRNFCGDRQPDMDDIERATILLTICGLAFW
jgi:hypothetical protein